MTPAPLHSTPTSDAASDTANTTPLHCIILAAGESSRLRPLTNETPKCLLPVGRQTILGRMLRALHDAGATRFTIVTGFMCGKISSYIAHNFPHLRVEFVANEDFAATNTAYSLLCARSSPGHEEIIVLDGDVLFNGAVIRLLRQAPHEVALALRTQGAVGDEDVKVELNARGEITRIGKDVPLHRARGESIGIARFSVGTAAILFETLQRRSQTAQFTSEYYEAAFQEMIEIGCPVHGVDLKDLWCIEIDTVEDYETAQCSGFPD